MADALWVAVDPRMAANTSAASAFFFKPYNRTSRAEFYRYRSGRALAPACT